MNTVTFDRIDEFLAHARPALEQDEAGNNLILGIALRLLHTTAPIPPPPFLAIVEDQGRLALAALITPPRGLLLPVLPDTPAAALAALAEHLHRQHIRIPTVNGPAALSAAFAEQYTARTGRAHRSGLQERLYRLQSVRPPRHACPGRLRAAVLSDLDELTAWSRSFHQEALGEMHLDGLREMTRKRIEAGDLFLWEDRIPTAMALKTRPTRHGTSISMVFTPPALRGRGYASASVAAISQLILRSGKSFCTLFTDRTNPTSNDIYQQVGYEPLMDFDEYRFAD